MLLDHALHRAGAAVHAFGPHAHVVEHGAARIERQLVVICHQDVEVDEPLVRAGVVVLQLEVDGDGEARADAGRALHLDVAAHHAHDVAADGHPQARALDLVHAGVLRAGEGLEDALEELRRHADAVVLEDELVAGHLALVAGLLRDLQADAPAVRRVLDGVAQQVGEDLLDAQGVADDLFVIDVVDAHRKLVAVLFHLRCGHGEQVVHEVAEIELLFHQLDLARLDLGHVEHLVDEAQQVLAGLGDLAQAVAHALWVVDVGGGDGGHADDAVHGRADVVAHVGEEVRLGLVGGLCGVEGLLQGLLLLAFALDEVVDAARADDGDAVPVGLPHERDARLQVDDAAVVGVLVGEGVVLAVVAQVLDRELLEELRAAGG